MTGRALASVLLTAAAALAAGPTTTEAAATGPATTSPATTRSTTSPATTQATAAVDADAEPVLARLAAAYAGDQPLHVTGRLEGEFDVAGRRRTYTLPVDGRTDGAGRYRHDAGPAGLLVSDGVHAYLFDARRGAFATLKAKPGRPVPDDVDPAVRSILLDENPALLLSLTTDPAGLLRHSARVIRLAPATQPADAGLVLEGPQKLWTFRLTPAGTIRSATIDYTPLMTARRATHVKTAKVTLTYDSTSNAPPPADAFTWLPPATATEFDLPEASQSPIDPATTRPARR